MCWCLEIAIEISDNCSEEHSLRRLIRFATNSVISGFLLGMVSYLPVADAGLDGLYERQPECGRFGDVGV